jgi:sugar phosphate isomerase/epimerase
MTTRRTFLQAGLAAGAALTTSLQTSSAAVAPAESAEPFGYCLNTSTIRGQEIGLVAEIEIAAKAGYQGIEPWIREIDQYVQSGGSLKDLGKRIRDAGLSVESAIGFAEWIVDDDAKRAKGLEEAKRNMAMLVELGGKRLAAPPVGGTKPPAVDLLKAAERYRTLLELGRQMGIVPQVEVWGFSATLGRLGEAVMVAVESGHPDACLLPDIYHIYKGGSDFTGLKLLGGTAIHVFHVNDYPADPPRIQITDAHRVYPGDGVAPLKSVFRDLRAIGFRGMLSVELFNRDYWKQDALTVARTALEKLRAAVAASA